MMPLFETKQDEQIAELERENAELKARNTLLLKRMEEMRDDLLMRAEIDSNGFKVVDCSSSVWRFFKEAIDQEKNDDL